MNIEQIDRYFTGQMDPNERVAFEESLLNDPELRAEVQHYQKAVDALKVYSRVELKNHLIKRTKLKKKEKSNSVIVLWLILASTFILLILWLRDDQKIPEAQLPVVPYSRDTSMHMKPDDQNDTLINLKNQTPQQKEKKANDNADQLFAAHFTVFTDEFLHDQVRSQKDEPTPLELFQQLYADAQFQEALKIFESLDPSLKSIDNFRFLQANALMATKRIEDAKIILQSIRKNKNSRYLKEVNWYLALCEIKLNNFEQAKIYLSSPELAQNKRAQLLLNEILN